MKKVTKTNGSSIENAANTLLNEIDQEITKQKNEMNKGTPSPMLPTNNNTIDFDTFEGFSEENGTFKKVVIAVTLTSEVIDRLKAKALLNDTTVSEHLSELIALDVEETFAIDPEDFNETTYQSAHEILSSILEEKFENVGAMPSSTPVIKSKTKIENLTINVNLGGESPKSDIGGSILAGLTGLIFGAMAEKPTEKTENPTKTETVNA